MALAKENTPVQIPIKSHGSTIDRECPKHGHYKAEFISMGFRNKAIYSFCPKCEKDLADRDAERAESDLKERIMGMLNTCGIPKRFENSSFANYKPICSGAEMAKKIALKYLKSFDQMSKAGASLIFCGKPGTGKTHLACSIMLELMKAGACFALYTTVFKAISEIKETFRNEDSSQKKAIDNFVSPTLLVIDEVGVQYGSDTEKLMFYQILNGRYENVKPTILISNLTEAELTEYVGERCIDRMREGGGAVVPFTWDSYRK